MILTRPEVEDVVRHHFGDLGEEAVQIMTAIVFAESGGKVRAVGDNVKSGHQPKGSVYHTDYGLAQINSVHNFDSQRLLTDPDYNLAAARKIYDRQGFNAWSTYKNKAYVPFYRAPERLSPPMSVTDAASLFMFLTPGLPRGGVRVTPKSRRNNRRIYEVELP